MFFSPNTRLSSLFSRYTYVMRFTFLSLRRVVPALHALVFQLLAVRTRVARQQSYFTLPWGQGVHSTHLFFSFPCGQGLHTVQLLFSFPCGHPTHSTQMPFSLP